MTSGSGRANRDERRKARTRQALLDAAKAILARGGSTDVSIQEITEQADVGLGSFYNHFTSKAELFEAAVADVLVEHASWLLSCTADIEDPAEVFATRFRLTARLASTSPAVATVFVRSGMEFIVSDQGLAPMATHDIDQARRAGRFTIANPNLGLVAASGCLLSYLQLRLTRPELVSEDDADALTERLLVMLGMDAAEAGRITRLPLPS